MKKISILGIALFAAVFCGCSDELEESGAVPAGQNTLTATIDGIQSRTSVDVDGSGVLWSESDAIGVYTTSGNFVKYALQSGAGEKTAVFSAEANLDAGDEPLYAVYPYDKVNATGQTQYGRFQMTIPPTMDYTTCSNGPMFAFVKGSTISFKHMAGLLKISMNSISENAKTVEIETVGICGLFNIYYNDGREHPILEKANEGVNRSDLTITLPTKDKIAKGDLFIPLAVGTHSNLKVSFYDVEGNLLDSRSKTTPFTVERGQIYAMAEINVATAVEVNSTEGFYKAVTDKSTDIKVTAAITLDKEVALVNTSKITFAVAPTINENVKFVKGKECTIKSFTLVYPYGVAAAGVTNTTNLDIELPDCKVMLFSTDETKETYEAMNIKSNDVLEGKDDVIISKVEATLSAKSIYLSDNVCLDKLTLTGSNTIDLLTVANNSFLIHVLIKAGTTLSGSKIYGITGDACGIENWWIEENARNVSRSIDSVSSVNVSLWDGESKREPRKLSSGTYVIRTADELAWFMSVNPPTAALAGKLAVTMDANAKLMSNIDLQGYPWVGAVIKNAEFDGNGKTIYNLNIEQFVMNQQGTIYTPDACVGLFAAAYQDAKIENITLEGVTITCTVGSPKWVGSLVGYSYGATAYTNCVANNVNINMTGGTSYRVGGLIGYIEGFHKSNNPASVVLTGCEVNTATIAATFSYGGLVGSMYDSATFNTCKTSNITLRLNDSPWNYGYVSKFIGDIANSKTSYKRTILINNCTADNLTTEEKTYLRFDKVVAEQNSSFLKGTTYLGNCPWCGLVEPVAGVLNDGKFVIKVDNTTLVNGKDFNVCQ